MYRESIRYNGELERGVWVYRYFTDTTHKCDGEETFFYGYTGRKNPGTPSLKELAKRYSNEQHSGGYADKDSTITGDAILKDLEGSREELDKVQESCTMMGIDYDTLLDRDIRYYNNCVNGFVSKREVYMNDMQSVGHLIAGKIAQAVWGNKEFSKPMKQIYLKEESRNDKVMRTLKAKGLIK